MASTRSLLAGLTALGLSVTMTACAPASSASESDAGYETVIAAVVRAESDAGGRAFEVEIEDGSADIRVAVDDRAVDVDVDLAGPLVTGRQDARPLDRDDRTALDAATTPLADAVRIAAATHGRGIGISEVDLEREEDIAAWRVEFTDGEEVAIAVTDGAVVRPVG
ncbi:MULTISPECIES: hypothetical protein [Microbacterium]|jgi:hypothetical protein|uniref:PepSY domain-containing protein n=1 Tax=Microbacterium mcarthurae TaxID=3035918 RepID=A0ABW9GM86_9MICO|nr:hypothetical protein [Microbacterium sp. ACRRU]MCG7416286.1 hypothetical protein [Microbacterium sp. ACRRU]